MAVAASPTPKDVDTFYRAAWLGLLSLRAATPRDGASPFGAEADHHWERLRGDLRASDRLDLLVRDQATLHPAAFAPRDLFLVPGLPDDEPFGPDWPGPSARLSDELFRSVSALPGGLALLQHVADLWGLAPAAPDSAILARIQPETRIHAAGAGAVMALYTLCTERRALDLCDQTVLCTDHPGTRQLFGLARLLLHSQHPARITTPANPPPGPATLVISPDASDAERQALTGAA